MSDTAPVVLAAHDLHKRFIEGRGEQALDVTVLRGVNPVSYTHLDVYKRQGQQHAGFTRAQQAFGWQQQRQAVVQFIGLAYTTRGQQARQQRVHTGLLQRKAHARRDISGLQDHSCLLYTSRCV